MLTDLAGAEALVAAEPEVIAHMNADHAETCRLYATKLLGAPDGDWRCVGCDPEGLDLQNGRTGLAAAVPAAGDAARRAARSAQADGGAGEGGLVPTWPASICTLLAAYAIVGLRADCARPTTCVNGRLLASMRRPTSSVCLALVASSDDCAIRGTSNRVIEPQPATRLRIRGSCSRSSGRAGGGCRCHVRSAYLRVDADDKYPRSSRFTFSTAGRQQSKARQLPLLLWLWRLPLERFVETMAQTSCDRLDDYFMRQGRDACAFRFYGVRPIRMDQRVARAKPRLAARPVAACCIDPLGPCNEDPPSVLLILSVFDGHCMLCCG